MSQHPKLRVSKPLAILAIVGVVCAFGVVLIAGLGWWGYRKGMSSAEAELPYVRSVLQNLSDGNYSLKAAERDFAPAATSGIVGKQTEVALSAYRDRLGKFKNVGPVRGFYFRTGTDGKQVDVSFDIEFEKAKGTGMMRWREADGKREVLLIRINSDALL